MDKSGLGSSDEGSTDSKEGVGLGADKFEYGPIGESSFTQPQYPFIMFRVMFRNLPRT